ncbi:glutamine--fructose-6-phosphate transaminase (isomerizing) [Polynucleobacter kasalickyi]|uniref:Glutamine--fructose-6-phosphate aminotransferase [isomerizing] n=1 Tax=Polynucleobacter kasalickyi TaxID=1938817 RepID=A0A1W2AV68_9BURK|nr:glutamine--fructose-6-phosphate transaminase (isomerizing) [Polynucleobacter kasalickyi]SMC64440.1 glutamine--fructose-6-phosphate transaminase [Polynucleobacter kasalickyi]
MCGIVGAVSKRNIVSILVEGLSRLEYRGYDSCGLAVVNEKNQLERSRTTQRVAELKENTTALYGATGIAHTRWATHGKPNTDNAHPHFSGDLIGVVHNGIIENYESLRAELIGKGYQFTSQTDTEVIAHLVHNNYSSMNHRDLVEAVRLTLPRLHGAYAIGVIAQDMPGILVGARAGSPLVVAYGEQENFLASDALAVAEHAKSMTFLDEGDLVALTPDSVKVMNFAGEILQREIRPVPAQVASVELGPYQHFMQKEIFEQPTAIANTIGNVEKIDFDIFGATHADWSEINQVLILACGTSYYSACVAKYWIEALAGVSTQVEIASEYRYRVSVPNPKALVVVVSQSGETADTLAALRHAKSLGHEKTLAICNVASSAMMRETMWKFQTNAGTEIGVASTKAFTTQLVGLYFLALTLAKLGKSPTPIHEKEHIDRLRHLPAALNAVLALEPQVIAWAQQFAKYHNALFLGRGMHYPIALEGALKLKEISYIHAEAYPAGELKHGPLALVDETMPVVTVAPNDDLLEKLKSNMQEVAARGGQLYVFADVDANIQASAGIHVIRMPENYGNLSPILHVVPLQLLAYHTALALGTDVDKPRNLAKSVTVE